MEENKSPWNDIFKVLAGVTVTVIAAKLANNAMRSQLSQPESPSTTGAQGPSMYEHDPNRYLIGTSPVPRTSIYTKFWA